MIGIAIKTGLRDLGIGTEMMKTLVEQAREMGLKVLTLTVFASNTERFAFTKKSALCRLVLFRKALQTRQLHR